MKTITVSLFDQISERVIEVVDNSFKKRVEQNRLILGRRNLKFKLALVYYIQT
jgi:hypothetical protein